jgi:hypothetical protein
MLLATNLVAQDYSTWRDAPTLVVVKTAWRGGVPGQIVGGGGAFSIDVKNVGTKSIREVHWDFYLTDTVRQNTYDHFKFKTIDKVIKPGKKERLTKRFDYHKPPNYVSALPQIMKVVYEDGSVWER